jgi:hypothetical protein
MPEEEEARESGGGNGAVVGGIVALGLISMLAKGGDKHGDTSAAGKTSGSVPAPAPIPAPFPAPGQSSSNTAAEEQQALALLNADRAANGLAPVRVNSKLAALAGDYAQDMIDRNFFAHNNPRGRRLSTGCGLEALISATPAKISPSIRAWPAPSGRS